MGENSEILVARTGFMCNGRLVRRGETFAADHPLIEGHERHFRPLKGEGITETATAAPDEQREVEFRPVFPPEAKPTMVVKETQKDAAKDKPKQAPKKDAA